MAPGGPKPTSSSRATSSSFSPSPQCARQPKWAVECGGGGGNGGVGGQGGLHKPRSKVDVTECHPVALHDTFRQFAFSLVPKVTPPPLSHTLLLVGCVVVFMLVSAGHVQEAALLRSGR